MADEIMLLESKHPDFEKFMFAVIGYISRNAPDPAEGKRIIEAILDARGFMPEKVNSWHDSKTDKINPKLEPDYVLCVLDTEHTSYKSYEKSAATMISKDGKSTISYLIANRIFAEYHSHSGFITHWMEIPQLGDK